MKRIKYLLILKRLWEQLVHFHEAPHLEKLVANWMFHYEHDGCTISKTNAHKGLLHVSHKERKALPHFKDDLKP